MVNKLKKLSANAIVDNNASKVLALFGQHFGDKACLFGNPPREVLFQSSGVACVVPLEEKHQAIIDDCLVQVGYEFPEGDYIPQGDL